MRKQSILLGCATVAAVGLAAGCTSSGATGTSASPSTPASTSVPAAAGKPISTLTVALASGDSPDPAYGGASLTMETTEALLAYTPRVNGRVGVVKPGLANAVPVPTDGGKTYVFHLAKGIRYSNGAPIKASDFKYAIERLYLANHYSIGKFSLITGAAAFGKARKGDIPGIVADNAAGTITFQLTAPMPTFVELMAQYFTAPVPSSTPVAETDNIPSSGPMEVKAFSAGQSYTLVKNPYFIPTAALQASNVDTIVATVVSDPGVALAKTVSGTYDYDDESIPTDQLASVLSADASQTRAVVLAETNMFSLNTSRKPFNDVRVRRAVNYAIDRQAMAKLSGGLELPTENVLPPGETSYQKITPYPYDLAKAKALVAAAGDIGATVTIDASGETDSEPYVVYLANQLKLIGLVPSIKVIPSSTFYGVPSIPSTDPNISWYPWNELIPDASDWIGQLFDGTLINPAHNEDWSMFNDPAVNKEITTAESLPVGSARDQAWAALDRKIVAEQAAVVPYANPIKIAVLAPRIDPGCFTQFVGGQALLSNFCLK